MTNLNFFHSRKIRKSARILNATVRVTAKVIGAVTAGLAIAVFLSPQAVHAEEGQQPKLVRQLKPALQSRYDVKVRQSLESQKEFGNPASALLQ
jgi:hypothetical protein